MSGKQWVVTAVLGGALVCVSAGLGVYLAIYLMEAFPTSTSPGVQPTELPSITTEAAISPTPSATQIPTVVPPTSTPEPPTPTNTRVIPLITPSPRPSPTPREAFAPDSFEPDDSWADASLIQVGETQTHNLHVEGDHDWVFFEAQQGRAYVIETSNLAYEIDTVVELYDQRGNELASDDDGGEEYLASRLWWVATDGGRLYVMIRSFGDADEGPGTRYDVSLRMAEGFRIDQYEPDNSRAQARPIAAGESQTHNRHVAGDRDWMYFEAQGGMTYVIETFNLGPNADTVVYLYDAAGNELASDDDRGGETWASRLEWTAPQDGAFYIMVGDWLQTSAGPGTRYDIVVRAIQAVEAPP